MRTRESALLPSGTAHAKWRSADADWPRDLWNAAMAIDGEEPFFLAWELARCAEGLSLPDRRAVALLAFAVLVHARDGSTRLPVSGPSAGSGLDELLKAVDLEAERAPIERVLAEARSDPSSPVARLVGGPEGFTPLVLTGDWLASRRLRRSEERVIEGLRRRLALPPFESAADEAGPVLTEVVRDAPVFDGQAVRLSPEQQTAVLGAMRSPFTVISGGPGTGKTSIVVSILRALGRLGVPLESIALAAPTGKAARRMEESIRRYLLALPARSAIDEALFLHGPAPQTLHRLLGYSPRSDRFAHHEHNPLAHQVVIVDECSMIDLFLMDRLVRSTAEGARLVLLGDAEQLPSVDAGAVFRDLMPDDDFPSRSPKEVRPAVSAPDGRRPADDPRARAAIRLRHSFRMDESDEAGRRILTMSRAVNEGRLASLAPGGDAAPQVRTRVEELAFDGAELLELPDDTAVPESLLRRWWTERVCGLDGLDESLGRVYAVDREGRVADGLDELRRTFAHFERNRILCLTRADARLTNEWLHFQAMDRLRRSDAALRGRPELVPGEPVIIEKNDYERQLFNGDQGLVVRGRETSGGPVHFMAAFPRADGFVVHPIDLLRGRLVLAYAMTVHKAQGSEFDRAMVLLPRRESPLLSRELLYTALTRSRRSVVVAGSRRLFDLAASREIHRHSGIADGLRPNVGGSERDAA